MMNFQMAILSVKELEQPPLIKMSEYFAQKDSFLVRGFGAAWA